MNWKFALLFFILVCAIWGNYIAITKDDISPIDQVIEAREQEVIEAVIEEKKVIIDYIGVDEEVQDTLESLFGMELDFNFFATVKHDAGGLCYMTKEFTDIIGGKHSYSVRFIPNTILFLSVDGETIGWNEELEDIAVNYHKQHDKLITSEELLLYSVEALG